MMLRVVVDVGVLPPAAAFVAVLPAYQVAQILEFCEAGADGVSAVWSDVR